MKSVKRKNRKVLMASLSGKNSDLYLNNLSSAAIGPIREAIINAATLHRVSESKRCPICGRGHDSTIRPIVFFDKVLYAHLDCIVAFNSYLSVELLDSPEEAKQTYEIISSNMVLSERMLVNSDTSILNHIGSALGGQLAKHLNSTCNLHDVMVDIKKDIEAMQLHIKAHAKLDYVCMFCGTGRRLILPPQAAMTWKPTDELPINDVMAREEALLITNDKKYIFHKSCMNEVVSGLQRFN